MNGASVTLSVTVHMAFASLTFFSTVFLAVSTADMSDFRKIPFSAAQMALLWIVMMSCIGRPAISCMIFPLAASSPGTYLMFISFVCFCLSSLVIAFPPSFFGSHDSTG